MPIFVALFNNYSLTLNFTEMKKVFMSVAVIAMFAMAAACGNNQPAEEAAEEPAATEAPACTGDCQNCEACEAEKTVKEVVEEAAADVAKAAAEKGAEEALKALGK